ncbi:hypothetical protein [Thermomonas hydrothermalis]|uniref:Putative zinc-finger n=1 Tax=Thermomonas hydrothermalis TaxID=213588 RepID=A0A1M4WSH1_9GAMM|nr:hypothetical protein [Thermomonas hydrothermalis]SHE84150.1 Putative zinc-finger [Thermomonas hydrothermalis]
MLNCEQATRLMSMAREQPLPLGDQIALRVHLMLCSGCRHFDQHLSVLRQIARRYVSGAAEENPPAPAGEDDPHA